MILKIKLGDTKSSAVSRRGEYALMNGIIVAAHTRTFGILPAMGFSTLTVVAILALTVGLLLMLRADGWENVDEVKEKADRYNQDDLVLSHDARKQLMKQGIGMMAALKQSA